MDVRFPNESEEYREARERLLVNEVELRRAMEAVAAARRALPLGGVVPVDYVFREMGPNGAPGEVRLSELFMPGKDALVVYQFMFPRFPADKRAGPVEGTTAELRLEEGPCPSCTAFLDGLNGSAEHIRQRVNFVVVAKAPVEQLAAFGRERGWRNLRLLSSAGNRFKRDYLAESADGASLPMMSVFERQDGVVRHFWSTEMMYGPNDPGQDSRHNGTVETVWNVFDLTRAGRPERWQEQMGYGRNSCCG